MGSSAASPRVIAGGPVPSSERWRLRGEVLSSLNVDPGRRPLRLFSHGNMGSPTNSFRERLVSSPASRGLSEAEMGDSRTTEAAWGLNEQVLSPGFAGRPGAQLVGAGRDCSTRFFFETSLWFPGVRISIAANLGGRGSLCTRIAPNSNGAGPRGVEEAIHGDEHPTREQAFLPLEFPWESGEASVTMRILVSSTDMRLHCDWEGG